MNKQKLNFKVSRVSPNGKYVHYRKKSFKVNATGLIVAPALEAMMETSLELLGVSNKATLPSVKEQNEWLLPAKKFLADCLNATFDHKVDPNNLRALSLSNIGGHGYLTFEFVEIKQEGELMHIYYWKLDVMNATGKPLAYLRPNLAANLNWV